MVLLEVFVVSICLVSKPSLAAYVTDLKPDVNCPAVLIEKVGERLKNPALVKNQLNLFKPGIRIDSYPKIEIIIDSTPKIVCNRRFLFPKSPNLN